MDATAAESNRNESKRISATRHEARRREIRCLCALMNTDSAQQTLGGPSPSCPLGSSSAVLYTCSTPPLSAATRCDATRRDARNTKASLTECYPQMKARAFGDATQRSTSHRNSKRIGSNRMAARRLFWCCGTRHRRKHPEVRASEARGSLPSRINYRVPNATRRDATPPSRIVSYRVAVAQRIASMPSLFQCDCVVRERLCALYCTVLSTCTVLECNETHQYCTRTRIGVLVRKAKALAPCELCLEVLRIASRAELNGNL